MGGIFERLNVATLQKLGRVPEWEVVTDPTGPPETASDGVSLGNTPTAYLSVQLREHVAYRTARIDVGSDTSSVYQITVDGTSVSFDAGANGSTGVIDNVQGLRDAINNDSTLSGIVTAYAEDTGVTDPGWVVRIEGDSPTDYAVSSSVTTGGGTISQSADATAADLRMYGYVRGVGDTPTGWVQVNNAAFTGAEGIDYRGFLERFSVAGLLRVYPQIIGADGDVSVAVGPTISEDTT